MIIFNPTEDYNRMLIDLKSLERRLKDEQKAQMACAAF